MDKFLHEFIAFIFSAIAISHCAGHDVMKIQ